MNCITIENFSSGWALFEQHGLNPQVTTIQICRSKPLAQSACLGTRQPDLHLARDQAMNSLGRIAPIAVTKRGVEQARLVRQRLRAGHLYRPEHYGTSAANLGTSVHRIAGRSTTGRSSTVMSSWCSFWRLAPPFD